MCSHYEAENRTSNEHKAGRYDKADDSRVFHYTFPFFRNRALIQNGIFLVKATAPLAAALQPKKRKIDRPASTTPAQSITMPCDPLPRQIDHAPMTTLPKEPAIKETSPAHSEMITAHITT